MILAATSVAAIEVRALPTVVVKWQCTDELMLASTGLPILTYFEFVGVKHSLNHDSCKQTRLSLSNMAMREEVLQMQLR